MKKRSKLISVTLVFMLVLQLFVFAENSPVNAESEALRVQMYMGNTSQATNTISPNFKIYNDGTNSINMSDVKIRYYYTKDSSSTQNFVCDSCLYNNANVSGVTGNFIDITSPTPTIDNYLEISFPEGINLAGGSSIELRIRLYKSDWSNYDQSNDYSFDSANTDYMDWNNVTAYKSNVILWGVDPNPKGFLVIVSSKIYGDCQSELNTYMSDLANEGWSPTLIKVNNVADSNYVGDESFHVCETPQDLKAIIQGYYTQGCKGFVLIGSAPSIPCAFWKSNPGSGLKGPTDLFYADMDDWFDLDSDGVYESYYGDTSPDLERPANPGNPAFVPDMICGRISAGAISESEQQEGIKTAAYLSKIHDLRLAGGNMSFDPKAFCFSDDDFISSECNVPSYLNELEKDVYSISNKVSSNKDNFMQFLAGGYRIGYETIHSVQTGWIIIAHPYGTEESAQGEYPLIDDINNMTVKVNYLHLNSCYACDYTTQNLGAALLFNNADTYNTSKNSYVYNVTGDTIESSSYTDDKYFQDLKSESIGTAFKNLISRQTDSILQGTSQICDYPIHILLGDPTIKYNFTKPSNKCPSILNDLADVNAYPNKLFNINFQVTDPENDPVFLDVEGLPEGASYDSSTKSIDWVPQDSQAGNSYNVTITAYNKDTSDVPVNKYVQKFTIYVSRLSLFPQEIPNPGFESLNTDGTPSDWSRTIWSGELSLDPVVKNSGNYSARLTGNGAYQLSTNVEPKTDYLISGYIKTSNVPISCNRGAYFGIHGDIDMDYVLSNSIVGTQDWTPVYLHWYSGNNTSMKILCRIDESGTAWFDDFKLEKDYNLGFEMGSPVVTRWTFHSFNMDPDTNSVFLSDSVQHSGLRSVSILSNQSPNYAFLYNDIPVEPNTDYRVSAWVKTRNINGGTMGANLSVTYGSNTIKSEPVLDADTEWRQVYVDFNSGNNTKIRVNCRLGDLAQFATGTAWFDDVTIDKIEPPVE